MARVKISEWKAKKLILGDLYRGVSLPHQKIPRNGRWVAKVDQGVKKRFKQGLVAVDVSPRAALNQIARWKKIGFSQFILEPLISHEEKEEQYLSLERARDGIRILHAREGGVDIEAHPENVATFIVRNEEELARAAHQMKIPELFMHTLYEAFERNFFSFVELNPLVIRGGAVHLLDAAVLVDSAGEFFVGGAWTEEDIVKSKSKYEAERAVEKIAATTAASLKLTVLNPNGSLFFLLSGGGGSIVIADEAELTGVGKEIGNYGEYSGGPTREETYLYAKVVLRLAIHSGAKQKAIVIAGGLANFTDVRETFLGIIDALEEVVAKLRDQKVKVFVRRGGPNEKVGLDLMRSFLQRKKIFGAVYGSDTIITKAIEDAIRYVRP